MRFLPLSLIIMRTWFGLDIFSVFYSQACHPWTLIGLSIHKRPETLERCWWITFALFGRIFCRRIGKRNNFYKGDLGVPFKNTTGKAIKKGTPVYLDPDNPGGIKIGEIKDV